jgi:hypothetical protein
MIEPKDFTKMAKHIVRRDNGKHDANIMHPMREWAVGLFVVGMLVLWGVVFTIALYRIYSDSRAIEATVTVTAIPYKAPLVSDTIQYYEKERTVYETMLGKASYIGTGRASSLEVIATTTEAITTSVPIPGSVILPTSTPGIVSTPAPIPATLPTESNEPVTPLPVL